MNESRSVDSHSSQLVNKEIHVLCLQADMAGQEARMSLKVPAINKYYAAVNILRIGTKDLIDETDKIELEKIISFYDRIYDLVEVSPHHRTLRAAKDMLKAVDKIYEILRTSIQKSQYFFRTSIRRKKGLAHMDQSRTPYGEAITDDS